jgi:hypothetical protein
MNHVDVINSIFEGGGAVLLCLNVRRILRDKSVQGISLVPTVWWTLWGFWNVYYYSAVKCPASFYAGIAVVSVTAVWVGLALHYKRCESKAVNYKSTVLMFFTYDDGRIWHDEDGELAASELTDRLQDYHWQKRHLYISRSRLS